MKNKQKALRIFWVIALIAAILILPKITNLWVSGLMGGTALLLLVFMLLRWRREKSETGGQE